MSFKKLPVFVFPGTLNFYLNDKMSHRQLLTLYNPYDFALRFKVLCTSPNKYTVIDPEGSIGPRSCVDIVIRHNMPVISNCNVTDKFRVSMLDHTTKQNLGKRDIEATLHQHDRESTGEGDHFQSLQSDRESISTDTRLMRGGHPRQPFSTMLVACLALLVCIVGLVLPTAQETFPETSIPPVFHVSSKMKLAFSFALGLSVMIILR